MIAVLEKRPRWMPELQRQLLNDRIPLRAFRSAGDLNDFIAKRTGSLIVVVDLEVAMPECLRLLSNSIDRGPAIVVIGTSKCDVLEPSLRELGVTSYHRLPLDGRLLGAECRMLAARET